ncbi:MAG: FHA domain-containing protein [Verrucomicrobiales bacterium]
MSEAPKIHVILPSGETRKYSLQMDSIRIGRAPDNTVVLEDGSLSAHHAVLHQRDNGFELVDLGSTNGIEVDGRRVLTHSLRHGDTVKIGSVLLRFDWPDQPEQTATVTEPAPPPAEEVPDSEKAPSASKPDAEEPAPRPRRATPPAEPQSGCLASLVLFTLTLLAPVIGMHVRHFQESGGKILISEIILHVQSAKKSETPVPLQP